MAMREKNGGLSVPQFGAWDSKNPVPTDYSMVFTRARANRKQHKSDVRHASLGNERELLATACQQEDPVMILRFLICYHAQPVMVHIPLVIGKRIWIITWQKEKEDLDLH
ncbi:hypothetical protein DKX38_014059 [Salix brachista]|uniref:RIN4 pathogenic type III effector avirulence factor Avr cleavage site domain-containing protein n=1 Tax=Salix brachista TaxID=2182728 RepID=A0A5N5LE75_9ROSI|nr:hypothetical protein DKX38_014059 [Salix brachista]